ncbi:MAG: hypothetical protein GX044_03260 [Firmicutes bacterium]|nr:hypothetical protein [Bacillota bacterium]
MRRKLKVLLIMSVILLLLAGGKAAAEERVVDGDIIKTAGDLEIPRGTTVNGNVNLNMGQVTVMGIVNGDVTANMGQVTVSGDVRGDVESNMGQVLVTGNVGGKVGSRMGEVVIDGTVGGHVETGLGAAIVRGTVGGDVITELGEVRISGHVLGSVKSGGRLVRISGKVDGDVNLERGTVELASTAEVNGRVYVEYGLIKSAPGAAAGSMVVVEELTEEELDRYYGSRRHRSGYNYDYSFRGAGDLAGFIGEVVSDVVSEITSGDFNFKGLPSFFGLGWLSWTSRLARRLVSMIILFALGVLVFTLFPQRVNNTVQLMEKRPGHVLLWGVAALLLMVPLAVLLAITIVGIPLILVEVLLLAAAWILGYTGLAYYIGGRVINLVSSGTSSGAIGDIALGVLVLGLIRLIPLIGPLFGLGVFVMAVGSALYSKFGSVKDNDAEALRPEQTAQSGESPLPEESAELPPEENTERSSTEESEEQPPPEEGGEQSPPEE